MNINAIKKTLISIPIIVLTMLASCDKADEHTDCISKDQLNHYIDSLKNELENAPKPAVEIDNIVVRDKELFIKNNQTTEIYLRVNPSNAEVDLKCFHLDCPDTYTKAVSYISAPKNVKISSTKIAVDKYSVKLRGQ